MLDRPYELLRCSWPRPVAEAGRAWISDPEWDAPPTHLRPELRWSTLEDHNCWTIDWRETFRGDSFFGGEMRRFHVVFQVRVNHGGTLVFWEDDGSLIRRRGQLVHADRESHGPRRGEVRVEAGDCLEIAQWQFDGSWLWGAQFEQAGRRDPILEFRDDVCRKLRAPEGPPLKIFCQGREPLSTILAIYSMILNGYAPSAVLVYGEHQWSAETHARFRQALPFAQIVPTQEVLGDIRRSGGTVLADMALRHWFVMKSSISLLCAPGEFCLMDDDILVLGSLADGLAAFRESEMVFAPDLEHEGLYLSIWGSTFGCTALPRTAAMNTGFYWLRNPFDPQQVAQRMLAGARQVSALWAWEQGLFAHLFHGRPTTRLPSQRYFYPLIDGLPGGIEGYDYASNPCGFATVHFGGPVLKPGDEKLQPLVPQILSRWRRS
ncbi:MAG: hypothetical protein LAQ69_32230 [Acidobacteriia bacterium]|nr:hypothetical protein [Terriglobia bacterium]